jgi:hypothetical protein
MAAPAADSNRRGRNRIFTVEVFLDPLRGHGNSSIQRRNSPPKESGLPGDAIKRLRSWKSSEEAWALA